MREVTYTIWPDVAQRFDERRATLDVFVCDAEIILHRQIPPFEILNALLLRGCSPRIGDWQPFEIGRQEYDEFLAVFLGNPADRFAFIEPPEGIGSPELWWEWLASIGLA